MKKFLFLIPIIFLSCTQPIKYPESIKPSANVTIMNVYQDYYPSLNEYGCVEVNYKVKNTGSVDIEYCTVYFEVTCKDGTTYTDLDNRCNFLDIGKTYSGYDMIYTDWKQHDSIKISKVVLQ